MSTRSSNLDEVSTLPFRAPDADLRRALNALDADALAAAGAPTHHPGCGNQNAVHPLGKYDGVEECGCRERC